MWFHLYVEPKRQNKIEKDSDIKTKLMFPEGKGIGDGRKRWRKIRGTDFLF